FKSLSAQMAPVGQAITFPAIITLCLLCGAHGYPKYWWDSSQGVIPEGNPCGAHPERAYPELEVDGFWLESPHGVPRPDPSIYFEFRSSARDLVSSLCPGANYSLQGFFPVPSLVLLTSSEGRFLYPAPTPGCQNRVDWGASMSPRAATLFNATYAVPCNVSADVIQFRVTSASRGYPGTWAQAATTMPVDASCAAAACPIVATTRSAPSPVKSPPPTKQTETPPPSPPKQKKTPMPLSPPKQKKTPMPLSPPKQKKTPLPPSPSKQTETPPPSPPKQKKPPLPPSHKQKLPPSPSKQTKTPLPLSPSKQREPPPKNHSPPLPKPNLSSLPVM
ncbi:hypothetical protein Vretifemale_10905, partial [Volvox reticuliferus]